MRKKFLFSLLSVLAGSLLFQGCDKNLSPLRSTSSAKLVLSVPSPKATNGKVSASFTISALFTYRATSGGEVVSGTIDLNAVGNTGSVTIPLPHNGKWLVSAEWIYNSDGTYPMYIGADEVDVQGTTAFTFDMGAINWSCYKAQLADVTSTYVTTDLYTFDSNVSASSANASGGDIQCIFNPDPTYPSVYFTSPSGPTPIFAYLGTGNWSDYAVVPSGQVFYNDTLAAKRAVLGPTAVMDYNDVYVVKLSPTTMVWLQIDSNIANYVPYMYVNFFFRVNHHGLPYLKFDVTHAGDAPPCNNSGVTLY